MCQVYLLHRKAVEHHRTPKRKRNCRVPNGGHVSDCGSVLPLLGARRRFFSSPARVIEKAPFLENHS
jgi:hypothetical protein